MKSAKASPCFLAMERAARPISRATEGGTQACRTLKRSTVTKSTCTRTFLSEAVFELETISNTPTLISATSLRARYAQRIAQIAMNALALKTTSRQTTCRRSVRYCKAVPVLFTFQIPRNVDNLLRIRMSGGYVLAIIVTMISYHLVRIPSYDKHLL
jgi:hypothetical protein